jgi:hypothetical protein
MNKLQTVSSIYNWSTNFSHLAYKRSEAIKVAENDLVVLVWDMTSSSKSCPKPERPDPPVATKSPSVRPNAKPLPTNAPSLFMHPEPGTLYQLHLFNQRSKISAVIQDQGRSVGYTRTDFSGIRIFKPRLIISVIIMYILDFGLCKGK